MRHVLNVVALVVLSGVVQAIAVGRSVAPGLDTVRFVETSRRIAADGLVEVVKQQHEQWLYPAWIAAVRASGMCGLGPAEAVDVRSAQVASALALVLCVIPIYGLAVLVFGRRAAVAGTALFCVLPQAVDLGPYAISDSLHLLFVVLAIWGAAVYFCGRGGYGNMAVAHGGGRPGQSRSVSRPGWLFLSGIATGVGVLARVEAILVPCGVVVTLAVLQLLPDRRRRLREVLWAGIALGAGTAAVLVPYLMGVGATTPAAAVAKIVGRATPARYSRASSDSVAGVQPGSEAGDWRLADGRAMSFAPKEATQTSRRRGWGPAVWCWAWELSKAFGYWVGLLEVYALWRMRGTRPSDVDRFCSLFFGVFSVAVVGFAAWEGYVSARHLLPLAAMLAGGLGWGALELGRNLPLRTAPGVAGAIVAVMVGLTCLPQSLYRPFGHGAAAHREAAAWLAGPMAQAGNVVDTRGLTGLYSGRKTWMYASGREGFADPNLAYLVVEAVDLETPGIRAETLKTLVERSGREVMRFPAPGDRPLHDVIVFEWQHRPGTADATVVSRLHSDRR